VLNVFVGLTDDRIDAVRVGANQLFIEILSKNPKEWSEQYVIPKIFSGKENQGYIKKQNLLEIIEKTAPHVSEKTLKETYQATLTLYVTDKVSNVRLKALQVLKTNPKLSYPTI
jgi:Ca2+-binding EF-hand superfamily protein